MAINFSIISQIISKILIAPFRALYLSRLISINSYVQIANAMNGASLVLLTIYVSLIGSHPAQRAWVVAFFSQIERLFWVKKINLLSRIYFVFIIQMFLFPLDILNASRVYSWLFYLLILCFVGSSCLWQKFLFFLMSGFIQFFFWGQIHLYSWVLSPVVLAIFPLILVACIIEVFLGNLFGFSSLMIDSFFDLLLKIEDLSQSYGGIFYFKGLWSSGLKMLISLSLIIFLLIFLYVSPKHNKDTPA